MSRLKEGQKCPCMFKKPGCPYLNPLNEDPELTLTGRLQATTVGPHLLNTHPQPEICFVSPLKRTLQTATFGLSTAHGLDIPMIAVEMVRERMGLHVCDKRTDKAKVSRNFRAVDFTDIPPGPEDYPVERETKIETAQRGRQFFLTLKDRPENSILVVTHSSLLYNTMSKCFECPNPKSKSRVSSSRLAMLRNIIFVFFL